MSGITDPVKQKLLLAINRDYQGVMLSSLAANTGPDMRQGARQTAEAIRRERDADIAAALTPAEFAEYQLRQTDVATHLRSTLGKYCQSEDEYRALYAACNAVPPSSSLAELNTRLTNQQLLEQARKVFPPDRYAEVEQAFAPGAERLNRLAGRLGLVLVTVAPVHVAQQELKQRATAVRHDRALTAEQRRAQLSAIANEATARITSTLGERGFAAYREYDGAWIDELTAPDAAP